MVRTDTTFGLTAAGSEWLLEGNAPDLGFLPNTHQKFFSQVQIAFGLSRLDAMFAICCATSAISGLGAFYEDPFGRSIPLALQIIILRDPVPNLRIAVSTLLGVVSALELEEIEMKSLDPGRRREFETRFADDRGLFSDEVETTENIKSLLQPYNRDRCKLRSGWLGEAAHDIQGPVQLVQGLLWQGSADLLDSVSGPRMARALPWVLTVGPSLTAQQIEQGQFLDNWEKIARWQLDLASRSMPFLRLQFEDDATTRLRRLMTASAEFAEPGSIASVLLDCAATQVAKLSGLIKVSTAMGLEHPIKDEMVEFASFIYRRTLHSMLSFYTSRSKEAPRTETVSENRVVNSLKRHGPMTVRDITRNLNNMKTDEVRNALERAKKSGQVTVDVEGVYSLAE